MDDQATDLLEFDVYESPKDDIFEVDHFAGFVTDDDPMDSPDENLFDSSDSEFGGPANSTPPLESSLFRAMRENARQDRIDSKRTCRELYLNTGSINHQKSRWAWWNSFSSFMEIVLEKSSDTVPTGEHIERFTSVIVKYVKPKSGQAPSYTWLENGVRHITDMCIFKYETFRLSKHNRMHITSNLNRLLQEGKVLGEGSAAGVSAAGGSTAE